MAAPQVAPLPPFFTLAPGMQVVITAISATTGNTVSGVQVSGVSLSVDPEAGTTTPEETQPAGPIFLVPGPAMV